MATIAATTTQAQKIEEKIDSLTAGALPYFNSIFKRIHFRNLKA
jgi:hypothetical protein